MCHDTSLRRQRSAGRQEGVNPAQGTSADQERAWGGKGFLLPVEHTMLFRPAPPHLAGQKNGMSEKLFLAQAVVGKQLT